MSLDSIGEIKGLIKDQAYKKSQLEQELGQVNETLANLILSVHLVLLLLPVIFLERYSFYLLQIKSFVGDYQTAVREHEKLRTAASACSDSVKYLGAAFESLKLTSSENSDADQIKSLFHQSITSYRSVCERLEELESTLDSTEIEGVNCSCEALCLLLDENKKSCLELNSLKEQCDAMEAQFRDLTRKQIGLQQELVTLQCSTLLLAHETKLVQADHRKLLEKETEAKSALASKKKAFEQLQSAVEGVDEEYQLKSSELNHRNEILAKEIEEYEVSLRQSRYELASLREKNSISAASLHETEAEIKDQEKKLAKANSEVEGKRQDLEIQKLAVNALRQQLNGTVWHEETDKDEYEALNEEYLQDSERLQVQIAEVKAQIEFAKTVLCRFCIGAGVLTGYHVSTERTRRREGIRR
jgi:chromosome segregation ATPase